MKTPAELERHPARNRDGLLAVLGTRSRVPAKSLKWLERVKGIEPSYSAWKAAALPLSYTRARPINYHGRQASSTAMSGFGPLGRPCRRPLFPRRPSRPAGPLTRADSMPILRLPSTTKGGDPVSYTKRCHLAGIARYAWSSLAP